MFAPMHPPSAAPDTTQTIFSISLYLKLLGAGLSSVLGVIALFGDFHYKRTKRLTNIGLVTLAGLILGALLSVGTALVDKQEQAEKDHKQLIDTQAMLTKEQSNETKLETLESNSQQLTEKSTEIQKRTTDLLSKSDATLHSTGALIQTSSQILRDQQRTLNPIEGQVAIVYRTLPVRLSRDLEAFITTKAKEYIAQIEAAAASGHSMPSSDSVDDTGTSAWKAYQPRVGITLQIDKTKSPMVMSFHHNSELAQLSPSKELFDTSEAEFKFWAASEHPISLGGDMDKLPNLILSAAPLSLEDKQQASEIREPRLISWIFDFRKHVAWKYASLRLQQKSSDGKITSAIDLKGATMGIKDSADLCWVDLYAGQFQYTVPRKNISVDSTVLELLKKQEISLDAMEPYFTLPTEPVVLSNLGSFERPSPLRHPSAGPCR